MTLPCFLICVLERKERNTAARRVLGIVQNVSMPMGVCLPMDTIHHLGHHRKEIENLRSFSFRKDPVSPLYLKEQQPFQVSQREISNSMGCQTTLGVRKFFLLFNFNKPILFVLLATEKKQPSASTQRLFWSLRARLMLLKSPCSFSLLG